MLSGLARLGVVEWMDVMRRVRLRDSHLEERFRAERGGLCGGRPT